MKRSFTQIGSMAWKAMLVGISILLLVGCQMLTQFQDAPTDENSTEALRQFYVDSAAGDDANDGLSPKRPWKTLEQVSSMTFLPGDHIYFKRGSSYSGCVVVNGDGTAENPILVGAYSNGDAPNFTNPDYEDHNGNALQVRGDYQIIENLSFHHTAPAPERVSFLQVWAAGAVHISLGNDHAIIRNNEFAHIPKAIHSYSEFSLITNNYIHDPNFSEQDGFLSAPFWGPIGIHLGIGNQEVSYNVIENMFVDGGGVWGGDGGAFEIDDGRNHKDNIHIHHNQTLHNMGFLEISWEHDIRKAPTRNFVLEHNISRDYQDFVLWWPENSNSHIRNNTIIRTDGVDEMVFDTVFFLDGADIAVTENIIVVDDEMWGPVFDGNERENVLHENNVYWNVDGGSVDLGVETGEQEFTDDPLFVNFDDGDYTLQSESPAVGWGAVNKDAEQEVFQLIEQNFRKIPEDVSSRDVSLAPPSENGEWVKLEDTDPLLGLNGGNLWRASGNRNSGGTTRTLWEEGSSITIQFEGTQVRFYGLKSDYMDTFNVWIDGVLVAEEIAIFGLDKYQEILWESDVLERGIHTVELISNGDTVEVDFIEYR